MNLSPEQTAELHDLLWGLRAGTASPDELARLERLVCEDAAARTFYVRYMHLCADLHWNVVDSDEPNTRNAQQLNEGPTPQAERATEGFPPFPFSTPQPRVPIAPISIDLSSASPRDPFVGGILFSYSVAALMIGVGLLVASLVKVSHTLPIAQVTRPTTPATTPDFAAAEKMEFVAQVTGMVDCQWSDHKTATIDRAYVPLGRTFAIRSGLMQITYDTGAKVVLQGPCTYEVESRTGGYLSVGKLTARVEKGPRPKAQGPKSAIRHPPSTISNSSPLSTLHSPLFAVRTPSAIVTDLGTEFGVEVGKQGNTSTLVFRGLVNVQPVSTTGTGDGQSVQLGERESVVVERQGDGEARTLRRNAVEASGFVRSEQLPKAAEDLRLKPFRRWQAYSLELRRDPSLLAYYDFQQRPGEPAVLPNAAASGDTLLDGAVEQATWTNGRMAGKHALLFQNPGDYVQLDLPQTVDDLTLAAWVNVTSLHQETYQGSPLFNGLLMSDSWNRPGQVHWQLDGKGRILLGQFGIQEGHDGRLWESPTVFDQTRLRRWTHIATVLDRAARVRFYVDGQLLGEVAAADPVRIPICIGPARIGVWNEQPRIFNGRIDELAVFGRALESDEIKLMFEAGNPVGNHSIARSTGGGQRVDK